MKNQRGTTLVEVLIIITILTLLTSIIFIQLNSTKMQLELEQFIDQLQRDINWALHYADINQEIMYLYFTKERYIYYFQVGSKIILKRSYSSRFIIENNLIKHRLIIDATGLVSNFGTLTVYEESRLIATLSIQMFTGIIREERY